MRRTSVPRRSPRILEENTNPPLFCAIRVTAANPAEKPSFSTWIDIEPSRMIFETSPVWVDGCLGEGTGSFLHCVPVAPEAPLRLPNEVRPTGVVEAAAAS